MNDTIEIGVSKDWLDAYNMARSEHRQFANDDKGLRALHRWIEISSASLVVFEASGDWKTACRERLFHIPR